MKITNINYHNIDWIVKPKNNRLNVKQKIVLQKVKPSLEKEENLEKISKKLKEIIKKEYVVKISIHEKTKQFIIKIVDANTKEVIREMPWEKFLDLIASFEETFKKFHKGK